MTCPKVIRPKVTRPKVTRPKVTRPKWPIQKWALRNPAYRRHRISQPMRIEAQIQKQTYKDFLPPKNTAHGIRHTGHSKWQTKFFFYIFCFVSHGTRHGRHQPWRRLRWRRQEGWPMRDLELIMWSEGRLEALKKLHGEGTTDIHQTDITTTRANQPSGPI